MKKLIIIFVAVFFTACDSKFEPLYTNNGHFDQDDFSLKLSSINGGEFFFGIITDGVYISDQNGEAIKFKDRVEFSDFMTERGFKVEIGVVKNGYLVNVSIL